MAGSRQVYIVQSRLSEAAYAPPDIRPFNSEDPHSPRLRSTTHPAQTTLAGLWIGRFDLVLPWSAPRRAKPGAVSGTILFGDATANPGMPDTGRRTYQGEFVIDFRPFGFRPESRQVIGWRIGRDGVRILLNPAIDYGLIHLAGKVAGDRIRGRWTRIGDSRGAIGTFMLERSEAEARRE